MRVILVLCRRWLVMIANHFRWDLVGLLTCHHGGLLLTPTDDLAILKLLRLRNLLILRIFTLLLLSGGIWMQLWKIKFRNVNWRWHGHFPTSNVRTLILFLRWRAGSVGVLGYNAVVNYMIGYPLFIVLALLLMPQVRMGFVSLLFLLQWLRRENMQWTG